MKVFNKVVLSLIICFIFSSKNANASPPAFTRNDISMYISSDAVVEAVVIKSRRWSEGIATLHLVAEYKVVDVFKGDVHKKLTGVENDSILKLPEEILKRDFSLEVLFLYIPGWVETDQIEKIAKLLAKVNSEIPFTILAFFGEYKLNNTPSPNLNQMLKAYQAAKEAGLENVRLGNLGQFVFAGDEVATSSSMSRPSDSAKIEFSHSETLYRIKNEH